MTKNIMKARCPLALALAMGLASLSLAGCTEQSEITLHEPGVYKGGDDPLLEKQKDPAHIEALKERFAKGQSDR